MRCDVGSVEHNLLLVSITKIQDGNVNYSHRIVNGSGFNSFDPLNPNNDSIDSRDVIKISVNIRIYLPSSSQLGFYVQDQVRLDALGTDHHGARFDHYKSERRLLRPWIWSQAVHLPFRWFGYQFDNGLAPFASYATSFEPAPGVDKAGNEFDPENAQQAEIGVKYLSDDICRKKQRFLYSISLSKTCWWQTRLTFMAQESKWVKWYRKVRNYQDVLVCVTESFDYCGRIHICWHGNHWRL